MRLSVRFTSLTVTFLIIFGLLASLLLSIVHVSAATADTLSVTCTRTRIKGQIEIEASAVRVQIVLASNLTEVVATKIVTVDAEGQYSAALSYPRFTTDTLLVISVGEWDTVQEKYLMPATIQSRYCNPKGGKAPVDAPLVPPLATPTFTPVPIETTLPDSEHVEYFSANPDKMSPDGCTTLSYWIIGAQGITLSNSTSTTTQAITDNPNIRMVCPEKVLGYAEAVTYTFDIVYLSGRTEQRSITIFAAP